MFGAGGPSWRTGTVGAMLCAGLVIGGVSPSSAGESSGAGTPALGSLPMGAGVHGVVDERSGGFSFQVSAGQVLLEWDSRRAGTDRLGLGFGWSIAGVGFVERQGGVRVVPSRGTLGGFEASASVPSGLAGYEGHDIRFSQTPGTLPARADGLVGEQAYAFVLRELGGLVSYFDAAGDPIAKLDANGTRTDWTWHDGHRLDRIVSGTGVVTALDWSDAGRVAIETRIGPDGPVRPSSAVELDGGRVAAVTDASGARTSVGYTDSGLASRVLTATGAGTAVSWQTLADGTPAAAGVVVTDQATGEPVTERRWEPIEGLASGWPASSGGEYRTSVADGTNRVVSTYDPSRGMTARETILGTPSGDHVVQRQAFSYPDRDGGAPVRADRPTGMDLTLANRAGAARTLSERYVFDDLGRLTLAADGTRYAYNAANQPVQETTPTGDVFRTGYWPSGDRATLTTATHTTGYYWDDGTLLNDTHTTADTTQTASYLTALTRESRTLTEPVDRVAKRIEITSDEGAPVARPTTTYATHDRHGNTTELTTETGIQSTRYTYTDYGTTTTFSTSDTEPAPTETSRYPFLYAGEYTNPTGTQHLAVRTYNPGTMSFTSPDLEFLQNRYGYANANPITNVDPSGRFAIHDFINGLTIGLAVAFTAITVAGTWGMAAPLTGWGLFAAGSALVGMGANIGGTTIAVMRLVNDHGEKFLEPADDERMTHAEYAFMAIGLLGSLGAAAPKMFGKSMANSTSVRPPTKQEPSPVVSSAEHVTQPTALDTSVPTGHVRGGEVVSVTSDPAGPNWAAREAGLPVVAPQLVKSDLVRSYMGGRSGALREMRSTAAYKTHRKLNPDSNVVSTVGKAKAGLRSLMTSYTQRVSGREAQIMSDQEVASFLTEHRDTILGIEHAISSARSEIIGGLKKLAIASPGAAGSMVRRLNERSPGLKHAGFPEVARLFAT